MQNHIEELFNESKKRKCVLDRIYDYSDLRFIFSADLTTESYFVSRLSFIKFPDEKRDFKTMTLFEKMRCPEQELIIFDEGRLVSDPVYIGEEITRLNGVYKNIEKDYVKIKSIAQQDLSNNPIDSAWNLEFTEYGEDINQFYTKLFQFLFLSYSQIAGSLKVLEDWPAWDQDLIKTYRNIIEKNIEILNRTITLEKIMCQKERDGKKINIFVATAYKVKL
jgi:hypothetical protein